MRRLKPKYITAALLFILAVLALPFRSAAQDASLLWLCDQATKKVLLVSPASDWNRLSAIHWEWSAYEAQDIPAKDKHLFDYISDVRLSPDGKKLLVAGGSGGGIALIRFADKKVLFFDRAGKSPHSAIFLPGGSLAVVSSQDNRLRIYFSSPHFDSKKDFSVPSPHGLVWDTRRKQLWVVGLDSLYAFSYGYQPSIQLKLQRKFSLPSRHGHDLFPRGRKKELCVTTKSGVYVFNPKARHFRPFGPLAGTPDVKSVCENPRTGQIIFVRAKTKWWSDTVFFLHPAMEKSRQDARFYKARWNANMRF